MDVTTCKDEDWNSNFPKIVDNAIFFVMHEKEKQEKADRVLRLQ